MFIVNQGAHSRHSVWCKLCEDGGPVVTWHLRDVSCLVAGRPVHNRSVDSEREAPTADELLRFVATLSASERAKLLSKARPTPPTPGSGGTVPGPLYRSWDDYLSATTEPERRAWCYLKARKANQPRLMSGKPGRKVTAADVWEVLEMAAGRCVHCGSLAVERRPADRCSWCTPAMGAGRPPHRFLGPRPRPAQWRRQRPGQPGVVVLVV